MSLRLLDKRLLDGRFGLNEKQIDDLGKEKPWEAAGGSPAHLIKKKPVRANSKYKRCIHGKDRHMDRYIKANLDWWNEAVGVHAQGDTYGLERFKAGQSKLKYLEREEVGEVAGKSLLHLQCHFGLDTLSWARLGAHVTGVDFSEKAIALARSLAEEEGLDATFVQSDVYDLPEVLSGPFDIVYASYGVIGWLPDLLPWGSIIARFLKPGGFFYIAEGHPFMWLLDDTTSEFKVVHSYFSHEPIREEGQGSYADKSAQMEHTVTYGWNHTFSEIFTALL